MTITAEPAAGEVTSPAALDAEPQVSWRLTVLVVGLVGLVVASAAAHIVQGTAAVGVADLWDWVTGSVDEQTRAVIVDSRLPRVAAGLAVGVALGAAGCVMQSVSRNMLASPDTLAVNSGAFLAVTAGATVGLPSAFLGDLGLAFVGGLLAAGLVFFLAGAEYGTVRLVLAGTVIGLVLSALSTTLIILNPIESVGLQAWESGVLSQNGFGTVRLMAPIVTACVLVLLFLGRRLDVMMLGDDAARALGVAVRQSQVLVLVLAVLLAAAAVTLTGPIGFVGLTAPAAARLLASRVPGLHRHRALIPVSALLGIVVVLVADVTIRALVGAQQAIEVPTGVVTSMVGALVLMWFAFRLRASTLDATGDALDVRGLGTRHPWLLVSSLTVLLLAVVVAGLMIGDLTLLLGDVVNWATGGSGSLVTNVMSARAPRVVAALLAGIALAVAGTVIQAVTRNPLADPSILGISGGASLGAVIVVTATPLVTFWAIAGGAGSGALVASAIVFGLAARGGFATDRLVLIGVAVSVAATASISLIIVRTDPFNASKALTWLAGSTYGRAYEHLVPLAIGCVLLVPALVLGHRQLDLLSIDEDTPRVLGVRTATARLTLLVGAVLLTAVAVAAIGLIAFVGLVAPHAARQLVGRRHLRVIPVAALLGAILLVLADTLGRTVAAPTQLSAGLLASLVGAPYFFYLLYRSRQRTH